MRPMCFASRPPNPDRYVTLRFSELDRTRFRIAFEDLAVIGEHTRHGTGAEKLVSGTAREHVQMDPRGRVSNPCSRERRGRGECDLIERELGECFASFSLGELGHFARRS